MKNQDNITINGKVVDLKGKAIAQPHPTLAEPEPKTKAKASKEEEVEALEKNSKLGKEYKPDAS